MKKWKLVAVAIGGAIAMALAYFLLVKPAQAQPKNLIITNPKPSYSISGQDIVLAELTVAGTSPFEIQYWINSKLFHTGSGFITNPIKFGFRVNDATYGFNSGSNSVYFVVKDTDGKVTTSNTISFAIVP